MKRILLAAVIATFAAASLANFVLVGQIHYYWNQTNKYLDKAAKKKKK